MATVLLRPLVVEQVAAGVAGLAVDPASRNADRVRRAAALALSSLGVLALAGWVSGQLVLASVQPRFIPMAPLTAIAFTLLGGGLALLRRGGPAPATVVCAAVLVTVASFTRLISIALQSAPLPDLEAALVSNVGMFGAVPLARVSPVTAAALTAAGLALLLLSTRRALAADVSGWLSTLVGVTGCTVLLGYTYGAPLLYGGSVIPVALPTGAGLALAGIGLIATAGSGAWPLRPFSGPSARARLLRAFLPATTAALVASNGGGRVLVVYFHANSALAAALSTVAAVAIVSGLIWKSAGTVGGAIDRAEQGLRGSRDDLERAVSERTAELARINQELDAFTSSVSHDLRAPLRHMTGFANLLAQSSGHALPPEGQTYLRRILDAGERMSRLIDDLLTFARTSQTPLRTTAVELGDIVRDAMADCGRDLNGREIDWQVASLPAVCGDAALLRQALGNLLGNAVKYTRTRERATIEIGTTGRRDGAHVVYVRDNGVGFDMAYVDKLFGVFQRLHAAHEFEGTGIGLANVRRIIERHGGKAWAEGEVGTGATFFISLPAVERTGRL